MHAWFYLSVKDPNTIVSAGTLRCNEKFRSALR
jgi:hypothetical protein